jgi:hypothetical protein
MKADNWLAFQSYAETQEKTKGFTSLWLKNESAAPTTVVFSIKNISS